MNSKSEFLTLRLSAIAAALTVLANISWALVSGSTRDALTILGVLAFATASALHAKARYGLQFLTRFITIAVVVTFLIEVIGVSTGFPFGSYEYDQVRLGPTLLQVPLLIPLAWFMMLYPVWLVTKDLTKSRFKAVLISALLMATWDLYLDPQMVNEGYWTWFSNGIATTEIPISNFFGWFASAALLFALVGSSRQPTAREVSNLVPYASLMWVWLGNFLVNVVPVSPFFNQPAVAWSGLIGMGIVLLPWVWVKWQRR
ncbi:unannotated protein [freshwater metagenome]|uniref:Unannotated protein n=1 Tax=freshwater metagenome TaxID=449393 RepID=A0A6J5ZG66_9ZZZZ|nr:carotenoid biosynthesis protein [Actinomycetota bacterium]MSW24762.1 carotenoid biosynthesis protein [Actinomycetota bacterium]MSX30017.1 carotenoid biosynthesis protein [Actinomycetota bacterium]MSX98136.1 carotenoid biosynthesis protein [Actinomycetota bacterium]MSZ79446.1 carotenoid biosynthesis protein [Actinomycetota bacterium]